MIKIITFYYLLCMCTFSSVTKAEGLYILIYQHMDYAQNNKILNNLLKASPRTIRKKSIAPYDRHILKIDRNRYDLSSQSSSSESPPSAYHQSLEKTILKKASLREFTLDLARERQNFQEKKGVQKGQPKPLRNVHVKGWRNNFYTNLLDWSHDNFVCVAMNNNLKLFNMSVWDEEEACSPRKYHFQKIQETINAIKCSPIKMEIAIGYDLGTVICYDYYKTKLRHIQVDHSDRITAIQWQGNTMFTGGKDKRLRAIDTRTGRQNIYFQQFHQQEVCSIKANQHLLATGGNDNNVCIYDIRKPLYILSYYSHQSAIKALDWMKPNILLSGGGSSDKKVKFWKDAWHVFNEIDTEAQVCGIKASINSRQIVTCHGFSYNQIFIWNEHNHKTQTIHGHMDRILYCALSPSGEHLATGAGDQKLKIWKLFPSKTGSLLDCRDLR